MASRGEAASWASQAALNAMLKYKPQKEGLAELTRQAREQFAAAVQAGQTEGILGQQAARGAVAPTQQIFADARSQGDRGRSLVAPILAALAPDSPFKAAAANEQAAGGERLEQSKAHALSDLQERSVAASELPAFARQAAQTTLLRELQKIQGKGQLLQGSEAADVQSEIGKQRQEANKQAQAERASERTANTSRGNSERSSKTSEANNRRTTGTSRTNTEENNRTRREAAEGKGPNGAVSKKEQESAPGVIAQIRQFAGQAPPNLSRAQKVAILTTGVPEQSQKDSKGNTVKKAGIPRFKPDLKMSAALDWAELGHLSPGTEKRLKSQGYNVDRLGVPRAPRTPASDIGRHAQKGISGIF